MNWTADEQRQVKRAMLGSWPGTITAWGKDAFAAYIGELEARGLSADSVLVAIRSWPGGDFPPSAPNLAAQARSDPNRPTFDEAVQLILHVLKARTQVRKASWEQGERDRLDEQARVERVREVHPLVGSFVLRQGVDRLRALGLDDFENEWREPRLRGLREAWEQHVDASERREVALRVGPGRGSLAKPDLAGVLGRRAQIESGRLEEER